MRIQVWQRKKISGDYYRVYLPEDAGVPVDADYDIEFDPNDNWVIASSYSNIEYETPRTSDGKPIVMPNLFPGGVLINFPGVADDITNGVRFGGAGLDLSRETAGDSELEFQFMEWLYLAGGGVIFDGGSIGDRITYKIVAPATAAAAAAGTGNSSKIAIGGGVSVIQPLAQSTGNFDVDWTTKENAHVPFTKAVPVPSEDDDGNKNGFFDFNPDTYVLTPNYTGKGNCHLLDAEVPIGTFVSGLGLVGQGYLSLSVSAIKPKRLYPQWKHRIKLHKADSNNVKVSATVHLFAGRKSIS